MEKIKVLIVEDNGLVAEGIASKLTNNDMDVVGIYSSGEEAIESMEKRLPDLILMDIQLAGIYDGISTVQIINEKYTIPVIYLSDYGEKKISDRAIKTFPVNYLTKPFNESELIRAIGIGFTTWQERNKSNSNILKDHIFIKDGQSHVKLSYNDIICLEAARSYCNVVTETKKYLQSISMSHVLQQINNKDFIQVHRSHVVNVNKITAIEGNIIRLGKHEVEMSKGMREELTGKLKFL